MTVYDLPALNAFLNSTATVLLVLGFIAIKTQKEALHKKLMISALVFSSLFLIFYLVYHYQAGSVKFPITGWIYTLYLAILIPHIILAAGMLPFIFLTFFHAFKDNREKHRKWAKITFPIWLYVSVTGVVIYLMLYQLAPRLV